ncbi:MAG: galactose mutarotase [Cereibacter sphaeroides]|uniref:Galactose mutarotase n=1 Tax=Cereibacter sphaeroides TaxID=1063 RepID=A0A2W5SN78_CERSP|nr:MAG: galactose mutarotase [Cereibacter sphaeroides]
MGQDGIRVDAIHLGSDGLSVTVLTRGAVLQDVRLSGIPYSLTLGGDSLAAYEGPMAYFGALVGPVANRIAGAKAEIAGKEYRFPANEGTTVLHGGPRGMHSRHWTVEEAGADHARMRLDLANGDSGFPGNRGIVADWRVTGAALTLTLTATTDAPTLINLANHSYWNLDGTTDTAGHNLCIAADHYLPVNDKVLPSGEIRPVAGAFDLRQGHALTGTEDYDHNFCLATAPRALTEVLTLTGKTGVQMRFATTEPGVQVYDGRRLATAPFAGHAGQPYGPHAGVAIEAQHWPDAPNHPDFPAIALNPGQAYRQETRWSFAR